MSQKNRANLLSQKDVIKLETSPKANTAERYGKMLEDLIDSVVTIQDNLKSVLNSESTTEALTLAGAKTLKDLIDNLTTEFSALNTTVESISAIMGNTPDGDNIVNKVTELLAIFQNYQEGVDVALQFSNLATAIAGVQSSLGNYLLKTGGEIDPGEDGTIISLGYDEVEDLETRVKVKSSAFEVESAIYAGGVISKNVASGIETLITPEGVLFNVSSGVITRLKQNPASTGDLSVLMPTKSGTVALIEDIGSGETQVLTQAAQINWDAKNGKNATITLSNSSSALNAPSNLKDGDIVSVEIRQDATGGHTLNLNAFSFASVAFGFAPEINPAPFAITRFLFVKKGAALAHFAGGIRDSFGQGIMTHGTSSIDIAVSKGNNHFIYLDNNKTLTASHPINGELVCITFRQDSTGGRTVSWNSAFTFPTGFDNSVYSEANSKTQFLFRSWGTLQLEYIAGGKLPISSSDLTGKVAKTEVQRNPTALTDEATINWDCAANGYARVTLGGNRILAAPTNAISGYLYTIDVIQDATGGRFLTWNAAFVFPSGIDNSPNTTANSTTTYHFRYDGSNFRFVGGGKGFLPLSGGTITGNSAGSGVFVDQNGVEVFSSSNNRLISRSNRILYQHQGGSFFHSIVFNDPGSSNKVATLPAKTGNIRLDTDEAIQILSSSATPEWNTLLGHNAKITLTVNATLGFPSYRGNASQYTIEVIQDATGGRTLAFHSNYIFPTGFDTGLNSGANQRTVFGFRYDGTNLIYAFGGKVQDNGAGTYLPLAGGSMTGNIVVTAPDSFDDSSVTIGNSVDLPNNNQVAIESSTHRTHVLANETIIHDKAQVSSLSYTSSEVRFTRPTGKVAIIKQNGNQANGSTATITLPSITGTLALTTDIDTKFEETAVHFHEDDFTGAGTEEDKVRVVRRQAFNYGDGEDGVGNIGTTQNLARTIFYTNLNVTAGELNTAGKKLFCNGRLTISPGAVIHRNGNAGGNATNWTGGAAAANMGDDEVGGSAGATAGATGVTGAAVAGTAGTAEIGMGGAGGASNSGSGTAIAYRAFRMVSEHLIYGLQFIGGGSPGRSGGSGAGDGTTNNGGGGGGAGGGAGVIAIFCKELDNQGTIRANGGTGGNGGNGLAGNASAGHGGGGGGGGFVYIVCDRVINLGTIEVLGGAGGTPGTPSGSGATATSGGTGAEGRWIVHELSTGKMYTNLNPTGA